MSDIDFHLRRARIERDIAYRSGSPAISDAHMRLSELHLKRALLLQAVRREPVGNVSPLRPIPDTLPVMAAEPARLIDLPA